ncbi:hypothetical protein [Pseudomonas brassicacearum]|uniref:HNH nuclease domain-containing protein n=1 Tax=Pseudomonas brassicacearum subsp. neoaurantiaca TaxID=494916 RepID=A0A7V8RHW6_9PSED|nr:hypothetical protein [Pseudomonas brassicacearum]MBA1376795.1 hypothetical protein [Pseudomonas brassicacearum subsp. neoaurantiaca]
MIAAIRDNWKAAEDDHAKYHNKIIQDFIDSQFNECGPKKPAFYFVYSTRELVVSSKLSDLLKSIEILESYSKELGDRKTLFMEELEQIFNYDKFISKYGQWNAYALCKKSKTRICPYCNHAYAFTIKTKGGSFRPTLDHFFYKDQYPHLALTLYNLVPSCSSCNSSLKGKKDFFKSPHLNPLFDDEQIKFQLSNSGNPAGLSDAITGDSDKVKIIACAPDECEKSQNSLKTFIVNERYDILLMEAIDFFIAKRNLEEAKINTQLGLSFNESELLRFDRTNYNKYLLGKMFADIYDSF